MCPRQRENRTHRVPFYRYGTRCVPILGWGAHRVPFPVQNIEFPHVSHISFVKTPAMACCKIPAQFPDKLFTVICPVFPGLLELDYPLTDLPIGGDQYRVYIPDDGLPGVLQQ